MSVETVRIFISSPGDVAHERERVERVAKRLSGMFDGLQIACYRWEKGQYFSAHETFQKQIPPVTEHDLVIGVLWSRIGSALPETFPRMPDGEAYASGTAFEILTAIEHRQAGAARPDVLVYRKTQSPPVSAVDADERRRLMDQLDALDRFIARWFVNDVDGFKAAFHSFETTDDFEGMVQEHLQAWLAVHRRIGPERRWRVEEQGSPFRGLEAFDREHRDVFFGRRSEIERGRELLEDAATAGCAFLLIEGASGTGKSSLARAGLLPRLQDLEPDRRMAIMRPGEGSRPLDALCAALFHPEALPELADGDFPDPDQLCAHFAGGGVQPVLRALQRAGAARREADGRGEGETVQLVLLVDQLEQLFAGDVGAGDRERFAVVLSELARSGRALVVATLRADAHAHVLAERHLLALINEGAVLRLATPGEAGLSQIIHGPAAAAWLAFERRDGRGLDETLVADTVGSDGLPLLQFALERLYRSAIERQEAAGRTVVDQIRDGLPVATLTFNDYRAFGAIDGAIDHQAELAFRNLPRKARDALPRLVRTLSSAGDGRPIAKSVEERAAAADPDAGALVDALVEARILVRDGSALHFAHERVLTAWKRAAEAARQAERFQRVRDSVAEAKLRWEAEARDGSLLIPSGVRLAEAEEALRDYRDELADQREFITLSARRARLRQRVTAAAAGVFAVFAVLAGGSAFMAWTEGARANRNFEVFHTAAKGMVLGVLQKLRDTSGIGHANIVEIEETAAGPIDTLLENDPGNTDILYIKAALLHERAKTAMSAHDLDAALSFANDARTILVDLLDGAPGNTDWLRDHAIILTQIGDINEIRDGPAAALGPYESAGQIQERLRERDPDNAQWARDLAITRYRIGELRLDDRRPDLSLGLYREADSVVRELMRRDPDDLESAKLHSVIQTKIGAALRRTGETAAAAEAYQDAAEQLRQLTRKDPRNNNWAHDLAMTLREASRAERRDRDPLAAERALEESLDIMKRLEAQDERNTQWKHSLALVLIDAGRRAVRDGQPELGLARLLEARKPMDELLAQAPRDRPGDIREWQRDRATILASIGDALFDLGRHAEALASFQAAADRLSPLVKGATEEARITHDLGVLYSKIGKVRLANLEPEAAIHPYREAHRLLLLAVQRAPGRRNWQRHLAALMVGMARMQIQLGQVDEAVATYKDGIARLEPLVKDRPDNQGWARDLSQLYFGLGDLQSARRETGSADELYGQAIEIQRRLIDGQPEDQELAVHLSYTLFKRSMIRAGDARTVDLREAEGVLTRLGGGDPLEGLGGQMLSAIRAELARAEDR